MNKEPIYYLQPEKGIVVCELYDCGLDAIAFMAKRFAPLGVCDKIDKEDCIICPEAVDSLKDMPDGFFMNDSYKGVAVTVAGDTYDEEFGKKLAYSIAMKKHNIALTKKVKVIATDFRKYAAEMDKVLDKAIAAAVKREENSLTATEVLLDGIK